MSPKSGPGGAEVGPLDGRNISEKSPELQKNAFEEWARWDLSWAPFIRQMPPTKSSSDSQKKCVAGVCQMGVGWAPLIGQISHKSSLELQGNVSVKWARWAH